jgi:acetyltransferase-like isoleucine patch superfamily enzyme
MLDIRNHGINNQIDIADGVTGTLVIRGNGNAIRIERPHSCTNLYVELGNDNHVAIGAGCSLGSLFIYAADNARVEVGARTGFNGVIRLLLHEPRAIRIGADSLFGGPTDLTVSDMHSIVDAKTGKRLNRPRDIHVGEHVWIGQNCIVLKGADIGKSTIIGAGSVVTGVIPAEVVAAGHPARVLREGVTWDFALLPFDPEPPLSATEVRAAVGNRPEGLVPALRRMRAFVRKRVLRPVRTALGKSKGS